MGSKWLPDGYTIITNTHGDRYADNGRGLRYYIFGKFKALVPVRLFANVHRGGGALLYCSDIKFFDDMLVGEFYKKYYVRWFTFFEERLYGSHFREVRKWKKSHDLLISMTSCNDCGNKGCGFAPKLGEKVRYNCHAWRGCTK